MIPVIFWQLILMKLNGRRMHPHSCDPVMSWVYLLRWKYPVHVRGACLDIFASRVSAREARRLGTAIISYTCSRTRQLRLGSYDRLFPNQDTMPKGGFGNLIALPLQKDRVNWGKRFC